MNGNDFRDLLERFRVLATDFRKAAGAGDLEAMESILGHRRSLVERLERSDIPEDAIEREEQARLVDAILELDREAERALESRRSEIGAALAELAEGRRGLSGYGAGATRGGKWIDERG